MKYLFVILASCSCLDFNFKEEELRPEDTIMGFSIIVPGQIMPEIILTLKGDGSIIYGPAWSEHNFYVAVCAAKRFGDCI